MPRCRDCKLYDLDAAKDKLGRVLPNREALCLWESTEVYPVSHIAAQSGLPIIRAKGGWMKPNEHHRCQRFIPREK